jgi:hypothetical protein
MSATYMKEVYARIIADIDKHGRSCMGVFPLPDSKDPTNEAFTYTIGNSLVGLPELLVIGIYGQAAIGILNAISDALKEAPDPFVEGPLEIGGKFPPYLVEAAESVKGDFTIQATQVLGRLDYRVMQVVFCDREGRFPWDAGCAEPYRNVKVHRRLQS